MKRYSDYEAMVDRLAKPGHHILESLTPHKCELLHAAVAIPSEAGEIADAIKKHVFHGKPLDMENLEEELGDLEFFITMLRLSLDIPEGRPREHNMQKLAKRYSSGSYSDAQAQARADKEGKK